MSDEDRLEALRARLDEEARQNEPPAEEPIPISEYAADDIASGTTDEDLAQQFSLRHADELRYVAVWDRWLLWDGCRWKHDDTMRTWDLARALCREASGALPATARQSTRARLGSAGTVYALLKLARVDRRHAVSVENLDADPWLLNTPGGTVDLRSGAQMPHDPSQLHTKITNATPNGACPVFLRTLERVLPDSEVRGYLQRLMGYALTGLSREHIFPFFWGGGRNGKGTVLRAVQWAMGDYAVEISAETLMESAGERHQTEMTPFFGARLAVGSEISAGKRWNEARIKLLTGGDRVAARYCAKDPFSFEPSHTLIVMGNNKPGLRQIDEAIRRRMQLVRFGVTIPESTASSPGRSRDARNGRKSAPHLRLRCGARPPSI